MIINETYTVRIISSDNPSNFIATVEVGNELLCNVDHNGYEITITTKDILGETVLTVQDFDGRGYTIPIIIDSIEYSYTLKFDDKIVDTDNPALIYYNNDDPIEQLEIVEQRFSTLYDRFLTDDESISEAFNTNFQYTKLNDGINLSSNLNIIQINMLSSFSETYVTVVITAPDGSSSSLSLPIFVVDGDLLSTFPNGPIILHEKDTNIRKIRVTGTDQPLVVTGNPVGFSYEVKDTIIELLPFGRNTAGTRLQIESFYNGNTKTTFKDINVKPFPLNTNSELKIIEVGQPHTFLVRNIINDIVVEGVGNTLDTFVHTIEYDLNTQSALVTVTADTQMSEAGKIKIIDSVEGRVDRVIYANVKFVVDLDITVVTDNVTALDIPFKIRFENAEGKLNYMAVSKLTGYSIRADYEYDVNPYNNEIDTTCGYIYVYPIAKDEIILRVADSRSFEDVTLTSLGNLNDFSKWIAIIPTAINQQDLSNNLRSLANYSDTRLKAGDFVGNTWITGFKYGINQVKKITYKVSPPDSIKDNATESLEWMRALTGTTHTLNINIRDGFILEDIGKNFSVTSTWLSDNIFETGDLMDEYIIMTDAQTVLIADETDRISVTNSIHNTGVIIYDEDGENVTSRISFEPVSYIELSTISAAKKIPMNKPSNCYDIKRMDSSVVDGEFKIFPSTKTDDSVDVLCEFGQDENGVDEVWTVIPEKSIRNFAEIVGKVVGENNIELDVVSSSGIHPEFYPSAFDSNNSLSYLFLELPYTIKSFSYTLDTREIDENSIGTFKILTDTSDIYHINGTANANSMFTRQGSTLNYNSDLVSENLGQVISLPVGLETYEHIENANGGVITNAVPSDRLVIMNTGSTDGYSLSETFLKELRFNSIYNADNIATDYWVDGSSSGIDLVNLVTLSVDPENRWIISDLETILYSVPQKTTLLADTTWLISNTSSEVIEMSEFVKVLPIETVYNISDSQDTIIDLAEFVNVQPAGLVYNISDVESTVVETVSDYSATPNELNYIVSDIESLVIEAMSDYDATREDFVWNISHITDIVGQIETNNPEARLNASEIVECLHHLYNISFVSGDITQLALNDIGSYFNVREIVETLYHECIISFVQGDVVELTQGSISLSVIREDVEPGYHEAIITRVDNDYLPVAENVRMSPFEHDKIISIVRDAPSIAEVPTSLSLTADITEIVSDLDTYAFNIQEFVTLTSIESIENYNYIITFEDNKILEIPTTSHFDSYHPVNRLWRDANPMDITYNDTVNYLSADIMEIITPRTYPVIEIDLNVNDNLSVKGHDPLLPFTIFQDARKADVYTGSTYIDMRNIDFIETEFDIIEQHNNTDITECNFYNSEFISTENDILTQNNAETTMLVDMRNLTYTGSETDITNQYFIGDTDNTVVASANTEAIHLLTDTPKVILQKDYKALDLVTASREDWTQQDIFNKWPRINGAEYFKNGIVATGEADDWYMSGDTIIMPTNTAGLNAFISPYKYENYTLESRLYSSNGDDDTIGLVAAHTRIGGDNYTLYVSRTKAGQNPTSGLGFIFSKNNGMQVITNISVGGTSGGWSGNWSKMKVVRDGDIFKVWAGDWNNSNYSTTEPIMTIDLNDYPEMEMLQGAKSYGYMTWSQADTRYYDNVFIGGSGAGADVEIETIEGEWVDFVEGTEYPTHTDHITLRSTEEIEFNLTFKERMVATPIDMRNLEYTGRETDIIDQYFDSDGVLYDIKTTRTDNLYSSENLLILQDSKRDLEFLDISINAAVAPNENNDFELEYKNVDDEWTALNVIETSSADYFISPTGDDSNSGTYFEPFRTSAPIPHNSVVVLKNGTYNEYTVVDGYHSVLSAINTSGKDNITFIGESKDGVRLIRNSGGSPRDFPIIGSGSNIKLVDVTVIRESLGGTSYRVSLSRFSYKAIFQNVDFYITGDYTYNYYNDQPAEGGTTYANCNFIGGNLIGNYSGTQSFTTNNVVSDIAAAYFTYETIPVSNNMIELRAGVDLIILSTITEKQSALPIDFRNIEYTGIEHDVIEQENSTDLTTINFTNILYTGTETDIITQTESETNIQNLVNIEFKGTPNSDIVLQSRAKVSEFDANPSKTVTTNMRTNIVSQKKIGVIYIGEGVHTLRENTYVVSQKLIARPIDLGDSLKLHLPVIYRKDVTVEAELIEFVSENSEVSLVSVYTEANIRETETLDFNISGEADSITINTYEGSEDEAVETVSIV